MSDLDDIAAALRGKSQPVPSATDRIWTVHDRGQQFGPHTEPELATLLASGHISGEALVWRDGSPRWIPITNIVPAPAAWPPVSSVPAAPVVVNVHNTNVVGGYVAPVYVPVRSNGWGTASLTLGLISLVLFCLPPLSMSLASASIFFGFIGIGVSATKKTPAGSSVVGIILSGLALLLRIGIITGVVNSPFTTHPAAVAESRPPSAGSGTATGSEVAQPTPQPTGDPTGSIAGAAVNLSALPPDVRHLLEQGETQRLARVVSFEARIQNAKSSFREYRVQDRRLMVDYIRKLTSTADELRAPENQYTYLPAMTDLSLGNAGTVHRKLRVVQKIDDHDVLVDTGAPPRFVWLAGIDAARVVDDEQITLEGLFELNETKTYGTAIGGTRTVFMLRQITLPPDLASRCRPLPEVEPPPAEPPTYEHHAAPPEYHQQIGQRVRRY